MTDLDTQRRALVADLIKLENEFNLVCKSSVIIKTIKEKYAMNTHDLKNAARALERLRCAQSNKSTLDTQMVVGVLLGAHLESDGPIVLKRHVPGGGWPASIGFPDELREALQQAFSKWVEDSVEVAKQELREYGVEVD